MFPSFLLSLREGLEAALIIGIVLGVLRKMDRQNLNPVVWRGAASAIAVTLLAAVALNFLGQEFEGRAEEIFEGIAMILAAGLLTWMIFWMRRQSHTLKRDMEAKASQAVLQSGGKALFILAFLAVAREGLELALFLVAARMASDMWQTVSGALLGLGTAVVLGWVLFASTRRLNLKNFFQVTNVLLILFAAGLVAHGVHEFNEAGLIPPLVEHVWDMNGILSEDSTVGELLQALLGYNGNPSLTEVLAYGGYFVLLALGLKTMGQFTPSPATAE